MRGDLDEDGEDSQLAVDQLLVDLLDASLNQSAGDAAPHVVGVCGGTEGQ
jgi:hypothetical protein